MQFNHVSNDLGGNIAYVANGRLYAVDDNHPRFDEIVAAVKADDEAKAVSLFDLTQLVVDRFDSLSERVSIAHSRVYVDGDEVADVYADQIVRFLEQGYDDQWPSLVNFLEKVYTNTDEHTRENLSRWLTASGSFTIDEDGDIVGYKGVNTNLTSVRSGPAVVNGEAVNGHVPNQPGSVVEMARSKVEHNPAVGCASGLHVGTWDYAHSFGSVVLEVKVNPRDVVSVPTDCSDQKMRVSRYKVVRILDAQHNEAVINSAFEPSEDYKSYEEAYAAGYDAGYDEAEADYTY